MDVIHIDHVGSDGDGGGKSADGTVCYVPFTLPGEEVRARLTGRRGVAEALVTASPARVKPACEHFGACGGCSLQHWRDAEYAAWKSGLLAAALRRAGFGDVALRPLAASPPGARRRVDLAVRRQDGRLWLGLHHARSAGVVELTECPVLHPALVRLLVPLRQVLADMAGLRREGAVVANLLDSGPDLLLMTDAPLSVADRSALTAFARAEGLPRISWRRERDEAEPVCLLCPSVITLAGVPVTPPPGAFLQASVEGEAAIVAAMLAGLPEKLSAKARIAELYAGCGTLTFALAQRARVTAWEGDGPALAALRGAARQAGLEGRITAVQQDLTRRPVLAREFSPFAAVILDPPFAGAARQVAEIAASAVQCVIYVSCNPAALARDAATLRAAGFAVHAAVPIDQFLWSARLESVVVFARRG